MKNLGNEKLIFDNAVLSNFARINRLDLLLKLPCELITTKEVISEIQKGIKAFSIKDAKKSQNLKKIIKLVTNNKIKIISITKQESLIVYSRLEESGLGHGEISAIVLARELKALFVTDDKRAIGVAKKMGIKIIDQYEFRATIVILKLLLKGKVISAREFTEIKIKLKKENFLF